MYAFNDEYIVHDGTSRQIASNDTMFLDMTVYLQTTGNHRLKLVLIWLILPCEPYMFHCSIKAILDSTMYDAFSFLI